MTEDKAKQKKNNKKAISKICFVSISIIYLCLFAYVIYCYIGENRYYEISTEDIIHINAEKGQKISLNAIIKNKMYYVMSSENNYFISYNIYEDNGEIYTFENSRTVIDPIESGAKGNVLIEILAPLKEGNYKIEIDIVKEGEYWFKDLGDKPCIIYLSVI